MASQRDMLAKLDEEFQGRGKKLPDTRLPLIPVVEATKKAVRAAMVHAGLLN